MAAPINTGAAPINVGAPAPQSIPERIADALASARLQLPDHSTIHIKMAKQHPVADVISALGNVVLFVASAAITLMFAKRHIDAGSPFEPIRVALDVIDRMQRR